MAAGWRDEERPTMERGCECGPPIVLILKIPLEQAFFFSTPSSCHSRFDCVAVNHSRNPAYAGLTRRCRVNMSASLAVLFTCSSLVMLRITTSPKKHIYV